MERGRDRTTPKTSLVLFYAFLTLLLYHVRASKETVDSTTLYLPEEGIFTEGKDSSGFIPEEGVAVVGEGNELDHLHLMENCQDPSHEGGYGFVPQQPGGDRVYHNGEEEEGALQHDEL